MDRAQVFGGQSRAKSTFRVTGEKQYDAHMVTDPSHKLARNLVGKNVHMTTSRVLNKLYSQCKNNLQSKLLRSSLEEGLKEIEVLLE